MMKKILFVSLCVLLMASAATSLTAQSSRDRWKYDDYFPKNYFFDDKEDRALNDAAGEVVFYMRLAGVTPLRDISLDKDECLLRLNYIPAFAHPLFIQVRQKGDQILLTWQKGKALRGFVEHDIEMGWRDSGWVDITENEYYGNEWEEGLIESGSRQLLLSEWQEIQKILTEIDFKHFPHGLPCSGGENPYILEFKSSKNSISYYTECPDLKEEKHVTELLVSLVDTDYVDMEVNYTGDLYKTIPPAFPGGEEACAAFIQNAIHYPPEALRDLMEYRTRAEFVVEKDGSIGVIKDDSWPPSDYSFGDELIRVVKMMPKWKPCTKNGKPVRCYAHVNYRFVLPTDIRPQYGNPILETRRDKNRWEDIETSHRKLLQNPLDEDATLWMGKYYYWEYILEHKPVKTPSSWDSSLYKNDWETFYDRTPVVIHPGDSALKYFYKVLEMNPDVERITEIYMPVLQLEQQLHQPHNPLAELPYDTVEGVHFPYSYLINWPEDGQLDASKDYYMDAWHSFFWVNVFSSNLTKMQEPILYNNKLQEDEVVFRFSFFPSFHPPTSFRVVKNKSTATLYWKILITKYDPKTWKEVSSTVSEGHRKMTAAQYERLLQYMEDARLDERPRSEFERMVDGATWVIERGTSHGFKAHFTNVADKNIQQIYSFLAKLSGRKLKYVKKYRY